jgi:malonyl-CoA decarboxylase
MSARARAAALGLAYVQAPDAEKMAFLTILCDRFGVEADNVSTRIRAALDAATGDDREREMAALRRALEPPRLDLLRRFSTLPEGIRFFVNMRADVLRFMPQIPRLQALDKDLKGLLSAWFDLGLLELRRITWESPAVLLEKLIQYEAVHAISGWSDLKNRLDGDRRLFAFFHPRMIDEPLIFIEVASVKGIVGCIQDLLDESAPVLDPREADTAIFYSISNALRGLAGISFGHFLIKKVVENLLSEFPHLTSFSTLSPIPGFRTWLRSQASQEGDLDAAVANGINSAAVEANFSSANGTPVDVGAIESLAAYYLTRVDTEKRRSLDPVAHFHLSNGARIERINRGGDTSAKGLAQSGGLMVNYLYRLEDIEANIDLYTESGMVPVGPPVRRLLWDMKSPPASD